jgi:hypothetical protein
MVTNNALTLKMLQAANIKSLIEPSFLWVLFLIGYRLIGIHGQKRNATYNLTTLLLTDLII